MQCYYYDETGRKYGPFSVELMKKLVDNGTIHTQTIIETESGKKFRAIESQALFQQDLKRRNTPQLVSERDTAEDMKYQDQHANILDDELRKELLKCLRSVSSASLLISIVIVIGMFGVFIVMFANR